MKLNFYWYISEAFKDGSFRPACSCHDGNGESDEFIANYLMDDGGQFYLKSIFWLDEGLRKISLINEHEAESISLIRETWGLIYH